MTIEHPVKVVPPGKAEQWEQALDLLYTNFRDHSRNALEHFNDEEIHQARVHSRKLLTLFSILDPGHSSQLYPVFKAAQKRLGKVRDADVLIESFKKRLVLSREKGDKKTARLLQAVIRHQKGLRKKHRQKLADELPKLLDKKLDDQWQMFLDDQLPGLIAKRDANVAMRELEVAYEQKKKTCKDMFKGPEANSEEAFEALHSLRIAAKELRYTANAAAFALSQKFHAHEDIYKEIQEQLGQINDKRLWLQTLNSIGREELDIGKKTWAAFTGMLQAEVLEALHHNDVVHIPDRSK